MTAIIAFFVIFVAFTLAALYWVYKKRRAETPSEFYVAGRRISAPENGIALFGAYIFVSSFFTLTGQIALVGIDGFLFSTGFFVAWVVALLLIAEPIRNAGKFTFGDILSIRAREHPARVAAAILTLVLFLCYIVIQMTLAGGLVATLLHTSSLATEALFVVLFGVLTTAYVYFGGMEGVTRVQAIKGVLMLIAVVITAVFLLARYGGNVSAIFGDGVKKSGPFGPAFLNTGPAFGMGTVNKVGFVSKLLTLVAGQAILPFLFMRFNAVRSAKAARQSVAWAGGMIAPYYLLAILIGFGVTAVLGGKVVTTDSQRNAATPQLVAHLGGTPLLGLLGAVGFLIVLAVVAGMMINACAAFTHDLYVNVLKKGNVSPEKEVRVARRTALVLGLASIVISIAMMRQHVEFLLSFEVNLAASTVLPVIIYSLFWRRFNTAGMLWTIYGGMGIATLLEVFGPRVSGNPAALFSTAAFNWFPWEDVGLVSVPVAFALGYLGSILSRERNEAGFAEMEVRALTGAGALRDIAVPLDIAAVRDADDKRAA